MKKKTYRSVQDLVRNEPVEFTSPSELAANFAAVATDADQRFGPNVSLRRGRPRKGEKAAGTVAKTIKHSSQFWEEMAAKAKAKGLSLHEAMRQALGEWLATH